MPLLPPRREAAAAGAMITATRRSRGEHPKSCCRCAAPPHEESDQNISLETQQFLSSRSRLDRQVVDFLAEPGNNFHVFRANNKLTGVVSLMQSQTRFILHEILTRITRQSENFASWSPEQSEDRARFEYHTSERTKPRYSKTAQHGCSAFCQNKVTKLQSTTVTFLVLAISRKQTSQ